MSQSTAPGNTYDPESLIGDTYKVLRFLGAGGMGTVYAVENLKNGQQRALKLLNRSTKPRPDFEARFVREGLLLETLCGQPYLVEVYDSGRLPNGRLFIEMEHLQGRTLQALLADERLSMSQSVAFVTQLLVAIDAVHGAGIVHRDVKPANVFVLDSGLCKLLDFGVVKVLVDGAAAKKPGDFSTAPGSIVGTMPYIAPEYAAEKGKPDHRVDIFSAGAILGECLMGSNAFHAYFYGKDYIRHVGKYGYPSLQEMGSDDTPHELQRVFRLATMKDPAERYQTAQQFLSDLVGVSLRLGLTVRAYEEPSHDPPTPPAWSGFVVRQRPREIGARRVPPTLTLPDPMAPTAMAERPSSRGPTPVYPPKVAPAKPQPGVEPNRATASPGARREAVVVPFAKPPTAATRRLPVTLLSEGHQASGLRPHTRSAPWLEPPVSSDVPTSLPLGQAGSPPKRAPGSSPGNTRPVELGDRRSEPGETARAEAQGLALAPAGALAVPTPRVEARPHGGASVATGPLWARRVPLLSAAIAFGTAGLGVGVVASSAVSFWAGPSAVVSVAPEPRRGAPAGVVAPTEAPSLEPPAESRPPEVPSVEPVPRSPASPPDEKADRRARLKAKLQSGRASPDEARRLSAMCHEVGDEACVRRAEAFLEQIEGVR